MTLYTQEIAVTEARGIDVSAGYNAFINLKLEGGVRVEVDFNQNGEMSGVRMFVQMHDKKKEWTEQRLKPGVLWSILDGAFEAEGVYFEAFRRLRASNPEFDQSVERAGAGA